MLALATAMTYRIKCKDAEDVSEIADTGEQEKQDVESLRTFAAVVE